MDKRFHAYYSGSVQGIGFRFVSCDLARTMNITGWVKNLDDGRVEMVTEGEEKNLKVFLARIKENFSQNIQNSETQWLEATGEFPSFTVKF